MQVWWNTLHQLLSCNEFKLSAGFSQSNWALLFCENNSRIEMQRPRCLWSGRALSFWSMLLGWELAAVPYFYFILFWYSAFIYLSAVVCWQTLAFKLTFLTNVQTGIAWIGILNINNLSICCETNLIYLLCFSHIVRKGYNKCKISAVVSTGSAWIFHYLFKHLTQSPDRNVSNQAHYSKTTWNSKRRV